MSDQDAHIIEEIRAGNQRSFGALVDRHKDRAFTLAFRLLREREDAEEAVQDAFVRAFRSLDRFRGDARFSTWFYRILYNLCLTRLKRGDREVPEQLDARTEVAGAAGGDERDILQRLADDDLVAVLEEQLAAMPDRYRIAVTMFYVQEMSYEEIAAVLDQPVGTVKTNLFRARSMLRDRVRTLLRDEVEHL